MLLLEVRLSISADHDAALNDWYHLHIPRLLTVPGYESGRRYEAASPGPTYGALYEIGSPADLPVLLGEDEALRHPTTLSEWEPWERELVPAMSELIVCVYEQIALGPGPAVRSDGPVVLLELRGASRFESELTSFWNAHWGDRLAALDDVVAATLLKPTADPAVRWMQEEADSYLLLVECAGLAASREIADGFSNRSALPLDELPELAEMDFRATAYRPIARHWPLTLTGRG